VLPIVEKVIAENDHISSGKLTYGQILYALANVSPQFLTHLDLSQWHEEEFASRVPDYLLKPGTHDSRGKYSLK
jgi:hypothetical protein